jgi:integrase
MKRYKTKYAGVFYIEGKAVTGNKTEKIYYIRYRKDGKSIEEKVGRQYQNDMTPARAAGVRGQRIEGKQKSNAERREAATKHEHRWTIERLWEEYRKQLPDGGKRTDRGRWKLYLQNKFGSKEPGALNQLEVDRLRINLLKKLSPQTVKHALTLLKRIINFGINRGLCDPLRFKITMPKVDNVKTEDLTPEQMQRLFEVLEITPYRTAAIMMRLVLFTGMRRGELFKLKWNDVDFHRGFIHIREPKGGKSQKIPLNSNARILLEEIPEQNSEYIFPARGGGPRKSITRDVRVIKEEAGLPVDFRPLHGLRHVYATMLANSGKVDMFTLQKLMTHKSPQMTQRYAHDRDEAMQRAAEEVNTILDEALTFEKDNNVQAIE